MQPTETITPLQAKLARLFQRIPGWFLGVMLAIIIQFMPILLGLLLDAIIPKGFTDNDPHLALAVFSIAAYLALLAGLIVVNCLLVIGIPYYVQMMSPFLPESEPCDIPSDKHQRDLTLLTTASEPIVALGFEEYDRFYLGGTYRLLIIIYRNPDHTIQWTAVRSTKGTTAFSINSGFIDDLTIETSSVQGGGKLPQRRGWYLQVVPTKSFQVALTIHQDAIAVFKEHGYEPEAIGNPRADLLRSLQRQSKLIREFNYWPIRMTWWLLVRSNFRYRKTLREQIAAGTTQIPPQN
jgi:hypothetical protein